MNEVSNGKEAETITRHSNQYDKPDVGPAEAVERCGMLSHLCGVCHLTTWAPDEMADGIQ